MKHETMTKLNILQTTMILKLIIVHPHQDVSLSLIEVIKPIVDPSHKHHHLLPSESHLSYIYLYNFLPPAVTTDTSFAVTVFVTNYSCSPGLARIARIELSSVV